MIGEEILIENGMWIEDDETREAFLMRVADWVELRVGERLERAMSEEDLAAFERLVDEDEAEVDAQIALAGDGWRNSELCQTLIENTGEPLDSSQLRYDFAIAFFLDRACPEYTQIIEDVTREASDVLGFRKRDDAITVNPFEDWV